MIIHSWMNNTSIRCLDLPKNVFFKNQRPKSLPLLLLTKKMEEVSEIGHKIIGLGHLGDLGVTWLYIPTQTHMN